MSILEFSSEKGRIAFEPQADETEYYIYYLPYQFRRKWDDARYGKPWNDYLPPVYQADPLWASSVEKNKSTLPEAKVIRIESRTKFDAFTPMGVIASGKEIQAITEKYVDDFLIYTEDRAFPIRLSNTIPAHWAKKVPSLSFEGMASKNEYYTWQIGLWAVKADVRKVQVVFSDFTSGSDWISKDSVTCFNQGGTNWDGNPIRFEVNVPKGNVQALWCGIQIPKNAKTGDYTGTATLIAEGAMPRKIKVTLHVDEQFLADKGDSEEWRHSRLRWLNSTIGIDDLPVTPYGEMKMSGNTIIATGKTFVIDNNGLPKSIGINNCQVLAKPVSFEVVTSTGTIIFAATNLVSRQVSTGKITWTASSVQNGLKFTCDATMEYDGDISYNLQLSAIDKDVVIQDVRLISVYSSESSDYFMGAGFSGGLRPVAHNWDWKGPYDSHWMGSDLSGLHVEFIGNVYHGPLIADYKPGPPQNWSNGGKGSITETGNKGGSATLIASTGNLIVTKKPVNYGFEMLITPENRGRICSETRRTL